MLINNIHSLSTRQNPFSYPINHLSETLSCRFDVKHHVLLSAHIWGSCGKIACSLFVVSLPKADLFSFLSAFMPWIFCFLTTMTLSSHLADLFPSFAFEFAHFLLWFCPSSTSLRQMDSESFVSVGLNRLNKNRETYMIFQSAFHCWLFPILWSEIQPGNWFQNIQKA